MEVIFLKDHLEYKEGDVLEVTEERAEYFERCGIATKNIIKQVIINNSSHTHTFEIKVKKPKKVNAKPKLKK